MINKTGEFLASKTSTDKFGGLFVIKKFQGINEIAHALERYFKAATKHRHELPADIEMERIPLMQLSSLAEHIYVKTREASQNADIDMQ